MAEKNSFLVYKDWYELTSHLPQESKGDLWDAVFNYNMNGVIPDFSDNLALKGIFSFMKSAFDRNNKKYQETCKKNSDNARKRWDKNASAGNESNTNNSDSMRPHANDADNDNENVNDNDTDNDTEHEKDIGRGNETGNHPHSPAFYQKIAELYNDICGEWFSEIGQNAKNEYYIAERRKQAIDNILKTYTLDDIETVFGNAVNSDFLTRTTEGADGEFMPKVGFDWFMKEENFIKVLEGTYNDDDEIFYDEERR